MDEKQVPDKYGRTPSPGWFLSVFNTGHINRWKILILACPFGALAALGGGLGLDFSLISSIATLALLVYILVRTPQFGRPATQEELAGLSAMGGWIYLIGGYATAGIIMSQVLGYSSLPDGLAVLVPIAILLNALVANYALQEWNTREAAQKDIGKFLVRSPVVILLGSFGHLFGSQELGRLALTGATVLLVPITIELLVIINKTLVRVPHQSLISVGGESFTELPCVFNGDIGATHRAAVEKNRWSAGREPWHYGHIDEQSP